MLVPLAARPTCASARATLGWIDERATRGVFQLLRDINASGTAVVMATHNLELVRRSGYRTIEINRGQVVFDSGDGDREKKVEVLA